METTSDLIQAVKAQLDRWAEITGGSAWGADRGMPRIYFGSRRDVRAFFDFPDFPTGDSEDLLGGARANVYVEDCGQHENWYKSQRAKVRASLQRPGLALCALHAGAEDLAREIMADDGDLDGALIDEVSSHLANGRLAEAAEAFRA
ncbi:MAG: hypothetical protein AMXMBFR77_26970 [Phycisphaerales bacterium]